MGWATVSDEWTEVGVSYVTGSQRWNQCYSPDGYPLKLVWPLEKCTKDSLRLSILQKYILLHTLLCETFAFLGVWVCFPLCPCSLLEFLTSATGTALVLGLCLPLGIFLVSFDCPLGLCGSVSLTRLVGPALLATWEMPRVQTPIVYHSHALLVPLFIYYCSIRSWTLCLKNGCEPIFSVFPTVLAHIQPPVLSTFWVCDKVQATQIESPLGWLGVLFQFSCLIYWK